jgi:hypothetical protein
LIHLLIASSFVFACGDEADYVDEGDTYAVELAPGKSTSFQIQVEAPHQFALLSPGAQLNATLTATTSKSSYESEWFGTPYVNIGESGEVTVEVRNNSDKPLSGELFSISTAVPAEFAQE